MKEIIKECQVCGAKYKGCNFCEQQNQFLAWRSVVCKPEHFAYHMPIISYIRKQISKEEAKKELLAVEKEYGKIEYSENIKSVVNEIKQGDKIEKSKSVKTRGARRKVALIDEAIADSDSERNDVLSIIGETLSSFDKNE